MARILVIDDEKNVRNMVRLTLTKAGHEVATADDGLQGLAAFGDGTGWDLTMVDQRMPGMEGREVTQELRRRDPAARIVMITAFATIDLASDLFEAGVTDFLRKPFSTEMLRGAIRAALARPRAEKATEEPDAEEPEAPMDHQPPHFSHYLNGFRFWNVETTPRERADTPGGFVAARSFHVVAPEGEARRSVVGITPHVQEQIRGGLEEARPPEDTLWDSVCQSALTGYLWEKSVLPPPLLPLYELTLEQIEKIHRTTGVAPFPSY